MKLLRENDTDAEEQVLVLLTDGANTAGVVDPIKAAELAQQVGLRIYTIGIGAESMDISSITRGRRAVNPTSSELDESTLTQIATMTGGRYFRALDTAGLQDIYRLVDELEPVDEPEAGFRPVQSMYFVPLAGSFALVALLLIIQLVESVSLSRLVRTKSKVQADAG